MNKQIEYNLDQLPMIAEHLANQLNGRSIITLTGELGAGKTTLVKQLLKHWGVTEEVVSPTFIYVNCYQNLMGKRFFHFDLYRIANEQQFLALGFDEYLAEPNSICLIEWPAVIAPLLDSSQLINIKLKHLGDDRRQLEFLSEDQ